MTWWAKGSRDQFRPSCTLCLLLKEETATFCVSHSGNGLVCNGWKWRSVPLVLFFDRKIFFFAKKDWNLFVSLSSTVNATPCYDANITDHTSDIHPIHPLFFGTKTNSLRDVRKAMGHTHLWRALCRWSVAVVQPNPNSILPCTHHPPHTPHPVITVWQNPDSFNDQFMSCSAKELRAKSRWNCVKKHQDLRYRLNLACCAQQKRGDPWFFKDLSLNFTPVLNRTLISFARLGGESSQHTAFGGKISNLRRIRWTTSSIFGKRISWN